MDGTDREPDFVNAEGTKWWRLEILTQWAHRDQNTGPGVPLPNAVAWTVENVSGVRSIVLTEDDKYLTSGTGLEAVSFKIDILRMARVGDQSTDDPFTRGRQDALAGRHYTKDNPYDYFKDRRRQQEWREGFRSGSRAKPEL